MVILIYLGAFCAIKLSICSTRNTRRFIQSVGDIQPHESPQNSIKKNSKLSSKHFPPALCLLLFTEQCSLTNSKAIQKIFPYIPFFLLRVIGMKFSSAEATEIQLHERALFKKKTFHVTFWRNAQYWAQHEGPLRSVEDGPDRKTLTSYLKSCELCEIMGCLPSFCYQPIV